MPNKPYAYLLNVEASNAVFLKTWNTEFDNIITISTNQTVRNRRQSQFDIGY